MYQLRFKDSIEAYTPELIMNRHALLYCHIIGSDSSARGIAAGILDKANPYLKYRTDEDDYWRTARPKDESAKYQMLVTKLTDNAVSVKVIHEKFKPLNARDNHKHDDKHATHERLFLLRPDENLIEAIWAHIATFNTPLIPEFKDTLCNELLKRGHYIDHACAKHHISKIGNTGLLMINCNEPQLDQLVSELVRDGQLNF
jgi:hypothetical protein